MAQTDRPLPIPDMFRISGPGEPDLRAAFHPKPGVPVLQILSRRAQIGWARWNRFKPRLECQGQAEKRALEVEIRKGTALGDDLRRPGKAGHKATKRLFDFHDDACAVCCDQRRITAQLNAIAKSLLAIEQDPLAGDIVRSEPERLRKIALRDSSGWSLAAPLIFDPSALEVAGDQARQALEKMRIGVVRTQRNR